MKLREKTNQKRMTQLTVENKQLAEPLAEKEALRANLKDQLKSYGKDKMILKNLTLKSKQMETELKVQPVKSNQI